MNDLDEQKSSGFKKMLPPLILILIFIGFLFYAFNKITEALGG